MVLSWLGTDYTEDELAQACGTDPSGTTLADAADALTELGFRASFTCDATEEQLMDWLQAGHPVIVGLPAAALLPGAVGGHAVVVTSFNKASATFVDPAVGVESVMTYLDFSIAWQRRGRRALVVKR